ncbi:MAG: pilus assembly protein PilP [Nitrospirae bacterium]|nr:pilus assembly protein PilP [Nitrospirota bacterium]
MRRWVVLIVSISLLCVTVTVAEERKQEERQTQQPLAQQAQEEQELKVEKQHYIYNAAGRRDPFLSIIVAQRDAEKKKQADKRLLPPMEKFDLSQFTLIAIVWNIKEVYAVVKLPDGKFYNLKEGMNVGVNDGVIISITPDTVIVREKTVDFRGKVTPKDRTLKLR